MELFTLSLLLLLLSFAPVKVRAALCSDDEECLPVEQCTTANPHNGSLVCNIFRNENPKICCRIAIRTPTPKLIRHKEIPPKQHKKIGMINTNCKFNQGRIHGGNVTELHEFPWIVLLRYRPKDGENIETSRCSGTIISLQYVLTAAHCVIARDYNLISVRFGEHNTTSNPDCEDPEDKDTCEPPFEDITVERIIPHEKYTSKTKNDDIALIRLTRPVEFFKNRTRVKTICLPIEPLNLIPPDPETETNRTLDIAGWGYTENKRKKMSDVLMKARVKYLSSEKCQLRYDWEAKTNIHLNLTLLDTQMCAGGDEHVDTCHGDSGSGISGVGQIGPDKFGIFQYGIVSFGADCSISKPFPGIYTRVSKYINWILDNMEP